MTKRKRKKRFPVGKEKHDESEDLILQNLFSRHAEQRFYFHLAHVGPRGVFARDVWNSDKRCDAKLADETSVSW